MTLVCLYAVVCAITGIFEVFGLRFASSAVLCLSPVCGCNCFVGEVEVQKVFLLLHLGLTGSEMQCHMVNSKENAKPSGPKPLRPAPGVGGSGTGQSVSTTLTPHFRRSNSWGQGAPIDSNEGFRVLGFRGSRFGA